MQNSVNEKKLKKLGQVTIEPNPWNILFELEEVFDENPAELTVPEDIRPRILYWYHPDYTCPEQRRRVGNACPKLGSAERRVDLITDQTGTPYQFFMYNPWGENLYEYDAGTGDYDSPYRFNGKELDPETGNYYYGARYYDPKISVWLSVDPMSAERSWLTPYNFVQNNPLMRVDPNGMLDSGPGDPPDEEPVAHYTLQEIVLVAGEESSDNTWTSETNEWDYNGSYSQYQEDYPEFEGMSNSQAQEHWEANYSEEYFNSWDESVKKERGEIAVQKMSWFIQGFVTAGAIGMGALVSGSSGLAAPRAFNYSPRFTGLRSQLAKDLHFVDTRGPGYWSRPGHGQFPMSINRSIVQNGKFNFNSENGTWRFSINGFRSSSQGTGYGKYSLGIRPDGGIMHSTFYTH